MGEGCDSPSGPRRLQEGDPLPALGPALRAATMVHDCKHQYRLAGHIVEDAEGKAPEKHAANGGADGSTDVRVGKDMGEGGTDLRHERLPETLRPPVVEGYGFSEL